jgi:hypothetical protein
MVCLKKEFYASVMGTWRVSLISHQLSSTSTGISARVGHFNDKSFPILLYPLINAPPASASTFNIPLS